MSLKLYEIANEYQKAFDKLSEMELSPEVVADSLAAIGGQFEDKAKAVVSYIKNLECEILAIQAASSMLEKRHDAHREKAEALKKYLLKSMQSIGLDKINDPINPVSLRKNPPKLVIDNEETLKAYTALWKKIPETQELDKKMLKDCLSSDMKIEGAHLERGVRLDFN